MIEAVTVHLCTTCDEYYEAYQMADIEQHLCNDCAAQKEYEILSDKLIAVLDVTIARGVQLGYEDADYRELYQELTGKEWSNE